MGLKMNTKNIAQRMNVVNIQLINELEQEWANFFYAN